MKRQKNRYSQICHIRSMGRKIWIFAPLLAAMILSGIQTGPIAALLTAHPADISHHTSRFQQSVVMPYHDVLTAEILGRKEAELVIACSIRNKGKTLFQMTDSGLPANITAYAFLFLCTASALRRRNRQPYIRSWIIRYIHDQDGEKDGALSS